MRSLPRIPILFASVLAFAGCVVGTNEPTVGTSLKAISKTKWLSCWVRPAAETGDPFFMFDTVQCSAAIGEGPLSPYMVSLESVGSTLARRIDSAGIVDVGRIQRTTYPQTINVQVILDTRGLASNVNKHNGLVTQLTLQRHDQYTADTPFVIEQPVDVWPIEITSESRVFAVALEAYTVPLPQGIKVSVDATTSLDTLEIFATHLPVIRAGQSKTFYVVAPRGARRPLAGTALAKMSNDAPRPKLELDGPGAYLGTESGLQRKPGTPGTGTSTHMLDSCPGSWSSDELCDRCLVDDPACNVNGVAGCEAQWRGDSICDECLGDDPDCSPVVMCPESWRGDDICDRCLGNDPDCAPTSDCPSYWANDGVCDPCLGALDGTDCTSGTLCPIAWRSDGTCDECLGDDPDCDDVDCPASWRGDSICDACLGDDPDCDDVECPAWWRGDGLCDPCLGDDPDCEPACPMEWYGDGFCDACLVDDPDCEDPSCPWSWYNDGWCDSCLGDDPDCEI